MKRITSVILLSTMACATLSAQPIIENQSSSSAVIVRDPARQSSTEVDAAIYNPAGTAFVKEGLSFSVSGIANFGHIKANVGTNSYKINENYVMPSIQLAFKKDKWAFSGSFASEGGYRRNYKNGSPTIDIASALVAEDMSSSMLEEGYNVNYSFSQSHVRSHLYNWAIKLGAAYEISPKLSAYAGLRLNRVLWKSESNLAFHASPAIVNVSLKSSDSYLDESGWGIAPVIGLDYKGNAFNIGMKYEFGSHVNNSDGEDFTLPAVMSFGGNYQVLRWLNVAIGGDLYFKSAGNPIFAIDDNLYWDASVSATFTCSKSLTANIGWQIGRKSIWIEDVLYDCGGGNLTRFPTKLSAGIRYAFTDKISMDLGISMAFPQSSGFNLTGTTKTSHTINRLIGQIAG